jgi:hypothetical protein
MKPLTFGHTAWPGRPRVVKEVEVIGARAREGEGDVSPGDVPGEGQHQQHQKKRHHPGVSAQLLAGLIGSGPRRLPGGPPHGAVPATYGIN